MKLEKKEQKNFKKEQKEQRRLKNKETKLYTFRNFAREIKRIVWPKHVKTWKWFGITIAFLILMALFCFLISLGFSSLWNFVGIKS
ncbi:preprotein translocase subunit SecE [Metamycoplasma phocicerebrale]|uniref:Protein translocase subunit SecE n=1 Tax=Metamycoplasma phocicerebrale TaxID=142649 RepID=A0A3T0TUQ4_9BACT|nr:preprotein translocase subunit SecE [Metamycoplasma phocicerebrale]